MHKYSRLYQTITPVAPRSIKIDNQNWKPSKETCKSGYATKMKLQGNLQSQGIYINYISGLKPKLVHLLMRNFIKIICCQHSRTFNGFFINFISMLNETGNWSRVKLSTSRS